jgi:hypothetical protein
MNKNPQINPKLMKDMPKIENVDGVNSEIIKYKNEVSAANKTLMIIWTITL